MGPYGCALNYLVLPQVVSTLEAHYIDDSCALGRVCFKVFCFFNVFYACVACMRIMHAYVRFFYVLSFCFFLCFYACAAGLYPAAER